jgi:hypothetical protein
MRHVDLRKLNSLTKYPSIPTYHQIDPKNGRLLPEHLAFEGMLSVTEKVDGANTRVIVFRDGYIIGSREELLTARGDLIHNATLGIVDAARQIADRCFLEAPMSADLVVFYFETFGGTLPARKQYTSRGEMGLALFDVALFSTPLIEDVFTWTPERMASWREQGNQPFTHEDQMRRMAHRIGLTTVPALCHIDAALLPTGIEETLTWLREQVPYSHCGLDDEAEKCAEGVVVRSSDRRTIAKIRKEDYVRTLRVQGVKK